MSEERKNLKKIRTGVVVSNKMDKTISVLVERKIKHPVYKKFYIRSKKYLAHDEANECGIGDVVRVMETRKYSKRKAWRLLDIVERKK